MSDGADHLEQFKADLQALPSAEIFRRYIAVDACRGLVDVDERELRAKIAHRFEVQLDEVLIVGSAKLGFTLRAKKIKGDEPSVRPAFSPFSYNSDVDIAIVSSDLFDNFWKRCFEFWQSSGYRYAGDYWPQGRNFRDYIFRGWMRPDHLPSEGSFTYRREWFNFFRKLTSEGAAGDYKISAGVYRETYFLEAYQRAAIEQCRIRAAGSI
jgi:hypothetical protein